MEQNTPAIEDLIPKVRLIAQRFWRQHPRVVELDDVVQEGLLALLKARDKFDTSRQIKFWTYAEYRVTGAIKDMYAKNGKFKFPEYFFEPVDGPWRREGHFEPTSKYRKEPAMQLPAPDAKNKRLFQVIECQQIRKLATAQQQQVLDNVFFEETELKQVGQKMNLHPSRIGQIRNEACERIRMAMAA